MVDSELLTQTPTGLEIGLATPPPEVLLTPNIGVIGVGGAGGNAVNNMVSSGLDGVSFFVANTDAQALSRSLVVDRIQLGVALTQGLGAGANPEIGRAAAEEAIDKIKEYLKGLHLLFVTAGMGGGTGTGAAPVVARLAKEMGVLTVGVVSKPFKFEGNKRMRTAQGGIKELQKYVDTLIVIPNQNLFRVAGTSTTFAEAFKIADDVLCQGVRSITDLVMNPGIINLDFADVRTVLSAMGRAMMGTGEATGENRAEIAAEKAISNPLLDDSSVKGAKSILINISGGADLTLNEVDSATERIVSELDPDANVIFGTSTHEELEGVIRISLVATGIERSAEEGEAQINSNISSTSSAVVQEVVPITEEKTVVDPAPVPVFEQPDLISTMPRLSEEPIASAESVSVSTKIEVNVMQEPIIEQPPLFEEEQPKLSQIKAVPQTPKVQTLIDIDTRKSHENVRKEKPINSPLDLFGSLFGRSKSEKEQGSVSYFEKNTSDKELTHKNGNDFDEVPAFLRRK